jgi:hypothetical protein
MHDGRHHADNCAPHTILDLPEEILLDIFCSFESVFPVHDPSEHYDQWAAEDSNRLEFLGNNRLVCRTFNRLISPLLCPIVSVSLCSGSIDRLEGLSRNPLIAQGIRGIKISLVFRPRAIATDFRRYHAHADEVLGTLKGECDWNTEYQDYPEDDMSDKAVAWRDYHEANIRIGNIRSAWRDLLGRRSSQEDNRQPAGLADKEHEEGQNPSSGQGCETVDATQAILRDCFKKYAAAHADQVQIISNGSFVRSVVRALSRCGPLPFVWFNEDRLGRGGRDFKAMTNSMDKEALIHTLTQGHDWLSIESNLCKEDDGTGLFFPANVLTELPIACHGAKVRLRGMSVDCFPLLKGYRCLLPGLTQADDICISDTWARFAAACHDLEIFNFGKRGMNCSPIRPALQSTSDLAIINNYICAAVSGPHLQRFYLSMTPFRVRRGDYGQKEEEYLYPATPILAAVKSTQLRSIVLQSVETSEQGLSVLVNSACPRHLTYLYLSGVNLSRGSYVSTMSLLHGIVSSRRSINASRPNIQFNTLQGAEFGRPSTFDDNNDVWMFGSDKEQEAFWNRMEEHMHPELLKKVEQWISDGHVGEANPILGR